MTIATLDPTTVPTGPEGDGGSGGNWLEVALQRLQADGACPADPQAAVATFNSAF